MNSSIALIVNLPILFLLYIIIYFTLSLSGKRQFDGVSLNSDYFTKEEFKSLDKKFKVFVTLGFIIFSIIAKFHHFRLPLPSNYSTDFSDSTILIFLRTRDISRFTRTENAAVTRNAQR